MQDLRICEQGWIDFNAKRAEDTALFILHMKRSYLLTSPLFPISALSPICDNETLEMFRTLLGGMLRWAFMKA